MNLTESDVRAVANNRFWSKRRWLKFLGAVFGTLVVSLILVALTKSDLALLIFLPLIVYMLVELKNGTKYQKELVKQWQAEQK